MSFLDYDGGTVVAMKGKDCVAIAADKRFGSEGLTIATDFERIFEIGPHLFLGLPGLGADAQTVHQRLRFKVNLYELKENRKMAPQVLSSVVSHMMYEKRFGPYFVEPIIAGLEPVTFKPYICNMDLIGCINASENFVVQGTCSKQLYGLCELLWKPELEPNALFQVISQALLNAFDRDATSGMGAVVHIIEKTKITTKHLKTRMD